MTYLIENHTGNRQYYTKQQVWQWLKTERKWGDKVRQWLRAEGVSQHVLKLRRSGTPETPIYWGRAARRERARNRRRK